MQWGLQPRHKTYKYRNDLGVYQIENTTPDVLSDLEFIQQENNSLLEHTDVLEIITQTDQNGQDIGSEQEATTDPVEDTPTVGKLNLRWDG